MLQTVLKSYLSHNYIDGIDEQADKLEKIRQKEALDSENAIRENRNQQLNNIPPPVSMTGGGIYPGIHPDMVHNNSSAGKSCY